MNDRGHVEVQREAGVAVARMPTEVEISRAPSLRQQLLEAVENRDTGLVIDLSETQFLDSSGVNMLFDLAEGLERRQMQLALVYVEGGLIERVATLVDIASAIPVYHDVGVAAAALRDAPGAPSA